MLVDEIPASVDVTRAIAVVDEAQERTGSVVPRSALSEMERNFADAFVANGGEGLEAALEAGYPPASAKMQACRLLCRPRVGDYIVERCESFIHSQLPVAIRTLVMACSDDKALWKDRIKASTSLLERGGMAAPKGGVQVNVGVAVNGQQAQAIIASVHEARSARLSDIPPAMPDTELKQIEGALDVLAEGIPDLPGGGQLQGPLPGTCPVPGYSSAPTPKSDDLGDGFEAFDHSQGDDDAR